MKGQHEPLTEHPAAKLIWRAPEKDEEAVNGVYDSSGSSHVANGYSDGCEEDDGERLDPMAMQLS